MKRDIYNGLQFSTRFINLNWIIRIRENGKSRLVGVAGLIDFIGIDFVNKFVDRASCYPGHICICKLRRGVQVEFNCH